MVLHEKRIFYTQTRRNASDESIGGAFLLLLTVFISKNGRVGNSNKLKKGVGRRAWDVRPYRVAGDLLTLRGIPSAASENLKVFQIFGPWVLVE